MKQALIVLFILSTYITYAQVEYQVHFSGTVTDSLTGRGIEGKAIDINGSNLDATFYTDENGYYHDSVTMHPLLSYFPITIATFDCNDFIVDTLVLAAQENIIADFIICTAYSNECIADFNDSINASNKLEIIFTDNSIFSDFVEDREWFWDFGDDSTSTIQSPSHTYTSDGIYFVCLTIYGSFCQSSYCDSVVIISPNDCEAKFGYQESLEIENLYEYRDSSYGNPITWNWEFNDINEGTSTEQNPNYQYTWGGHYFTKLTIDCGDAYNKNIEIYHNTGCVADFSIIKDEENNKLVYFIDNSGIPNINWNWDFGDDSTSIEQRPAHIYDQSGEYEVSLIISSYDKYNYCNDTIYQTIIIDPCYADFHFQLDSLIGISNTFNFFDDSYGNTISWNWDFGDNSTSNEKNPKHTYSNAGTYTVCLTIGSEYVNAICESSICFEVNTRTYFTIGGQSFIEDRPFNNPFNEGDTATVYNYRLIDDYMALVGTNVYDAMGRWFIEETLAGNYLIKTGFNKGSQHFNQYFPTYYGNTVFWEEASTLTVDTHSFDDDIHLVPVIDIDAGAGNISGKIQFDEAAVYTIEGSKYDGIPVILMDVNSDPIIFNYVSNTGHFNFPELPFGTYYLKADATGWISNKLRVDLSDEQTSINDIVISLSDKNIILVEENENLISNLVLYPNPLSDKLNLDIVSKLGFNSIIEIRNIYGQIVQKGAYKINYGSTNIELETATFSKGFYLLNLINLERSEYYTIKFIKK